MDKEGLDRIAQLEEELAIEKQNNNRASMKTCTNCGDRVPARGCCQWCHTWRDEME